MEEIPVVRYGHAIVDRPHHRHAQFPKSEHHAAFVGSRRRAARSWARQQEIIQHMYKTKPLSTLRIWGRALNGIQVDAGARIVWSAVSKEDLRELDATSKETAGILDELISTIPDADVHALFTELEDGGFKASLRSSPAIDVNVAASRLFSGGGHARAAGFKVKQYPNFQLTVLECVQKLKEEMRRQRADADKPRQTPEKSLIIPQKQTQPLAANTPLIENRQTMQRNVDVARELRTNGLQAKGTDVMGALN